jgi:hypothetical protein
MFTIILIAILALAFFMAVPVAGASTPGVPTCSAGGIVCSHPQIHFTQSLDCYRLGARPGQWIGVYYFEGGLGIGCGPFLF